MTYCGPLPPAGEPARNPPGRRATTLQWNTLRSELLWVYEGPVSVPALNVQSDQRHGYWVRLIRRGTAWIRCGSNVWKAREGEWLVSPRAIIDQKFTEDAEILSVHFLCEWPDGENVFPGRNAMIFESAKFPALELSASELQKLVQRYFPDVRVQYLQQTTEYPVFIQLQRQFLQWLSDFYSVMLAQKQTPVHVGEGDERLERAAEILRDCPLDHPFPTAQLQAETSLGRAQLDRLFAAAFGVTTRDYWQQIRQEFALKSLRTRTLSIKEIGYQLGFKQPCHFTIWFSRRLGLSPQEFRSRAAVSPHIVTDLIPRE